MIWRPLEQSGKHRRFFWPHALLFRVYSPLNGPVPFAKTKAELREDILNGMGLVVGWARGKADLIMRRARWVDVGAGVGAGRRGDWDPSPAARLEAD